MSLAEQIAQRLAAHTEAARDAVGAAWADEAQAHNPAPRFAIRYEDGFVVVPLIPWIFAVGAQAHNIPRAFGRPLPFGAFGRFGGMFHPGYTHPQDFIEDARTSPGVLAAIAQFPDLFFRL